MGDTRQVAIYMIMMINNVFLGSNHVMYWKSRPIAFRVNCHVGFSSLVLLYLEILIQPACWGMSSSFRSCQVLLISHLAGLCLVDHSSQQCIEPLEDHLGHLGASWGVGPRRQRVMLGICTLWMMLEFVPKWLQPRLPRPIFFLTIIEFPKKIDPWWSMNFRKLYRLCRLWYFSPDFQVSQAIFIYFPSGGCFQESPLAARSRSWCHCSRIPRL